MRRSGKFTLWPAYFNTDYTWSQGRRVSKKLSLRGVKSEEIFKAVADLGLEPAMDDLAAYPKAPWRKSGKVIVVKNIKKSELIKEIAKKIRYNRARK